MSETTQVPWTPAGALEAEETRYRGRYFPYSGGSAGWFQNAGVLKRELPNNYLFHAALDTGYCLQKRFERLGAELARAGNPQARRRGFPILIDTGAATVEGTVQSFGERGVRVRIPRDPGLSTGMRVALKVQPSAFFKTEMAVIDGEVQSVEQARASRGADWFVGIDYAAL